MPLAERTLTQLNTCRGGRAFSKLVLCLPEELGTTRAAAVLVARRSGGALVAVPEGTFAQAVLEEAGQSGFTGELGPCSTLDLSGDDGFPAVDFVDLTDGFLMRHLERVTARSAPFVGFEGMEAPAAEIAWPAGERLVESLAVLLGEVHAASQEGHGESDRIFAYDGAEEPASRPRGRASAGPQLALE